MAVSGRKSVAWTADTWRVPPWLWIGVMAMAVALLHILLDMGVGLFDMQGRLSFEVGSVLVVIVLIHIWWVLSFVAGAQGRGGGILSAAVLALGWTTMMNGYPIVFCPPTCVPGSPLSDIAHVGSLVLGPLAALAAVWTLLRARPKLGWVLPTGAALLIVAMLAAFSSTPDRLRPSAARPMRATRGQLLMSARRQQGCTCPTPAVRRLTGFMTDGQ
jgi:hypothetical protein